MAEKILVTGAAGFIGFHLSHALLQAGYEVIGVDNLNNYYSVALKRDRLTRLQQFKNFKFAAVDIDNAAALETTLAGQAIDYVVHLAAQAGVRYSIENPQAYGKSNLVGFLNVLEWVRHHPVKHFIYASSSSVYGNASQTPFKVAECADKPVSLYAATKRANELMAESYSHLFAIPATGLRFFTVYGPFGRPDMAPMKFAQQIMSQGEIDVYNHGNLSRDFTYIDDIINSIVSLITLPPSASDFSNHRLLNIGRGQPVNLLEFIELLEKYLGQPVRKNYLSMQAGDVEQTWADVTELETLTGYKPLTNLETGIRIFADWYKDYYAYGVRHA